MKIYYGKSVLEGIAVGKIYVYKRQEYILHKELVGDIEAERERFRKARGQAVEQLDRLYQEALTDVGEEHAMIFEVHKMMLEDEDYNGTVEDTIAGEGVNAEYAVTMAGDKFAQVFSQMEDEYMKARAADVLDISARVVRILAGIADEGIESHEPVILAADDLTPSETIKLDKSKILAFVTLKGSANSHTAILARSMNLPSLVNTQMELEDGLNGAVGIVDGFTGRFIVEPEEEVLTEMVNRKNKWTADKEALKALTGKDNITSDGRRINLYANIGNAEDVDKVLKSDAGGIGLFRSEFLYLGRRDYPSEEEQFKIYKEVVSRMNGKKVIIRTLDIGADKQVDYFKLEKEDNPAMGYRAIRICLDRQEIFETQLRAIYRASAFGCVSIMFPMIISKAEIIAIKKITENVKEQLTQEGFSLGKVELGIMIETPAAALISDELAEEVDFFSIGTNDLTQYTLAIDRQNPKLENIYDAHHKAVLKLIQMTVENAHKKGIWAGICGELASDPVLTGTFLDMGIDELSVSPNYVLELRKLIREM